MVAILEEAKEFKVEKWATLNTVASPFKLPEGHSPDNQNVWTDEKPGSVVTANGYTKLGTLPSNLPVTGLFNYFKSSDGSSKLVCTDGQNVYQTTDFANFTTVTTGLAEFFQLRGVVIRDKLWMTNGSDPVMVWDGSTLTILDGTASTPDVPHGKYIAYYHERVWIYGIDGDLSSLRFSELTDDTGTEITPDDADAWPPDNELQISEGDADIGTGIFLYRGHLYTSKQYSIWRITGYDRYTYAPVKTRSGTGTRFQESIQIKDNLVHFIGVDGLYVFDGEEAKRISDIIDPATSDEGVFAFRNLQQPLLNNQFWNVSETADLGAGTFPAVIDTSGDQLTLVPADDSQADFAQGQSPDISTAIEVGSITLDYQSSGGSTLNVAIGATPGLTGGVSGSVIGVASSINDNIESSACGYRQNVDDAINVWQVVFSSTQYVGRVEIGKFYYERANSALSGTAKLQYTTNGTTWSDVPSGSITLPSSTVIPTQDYRYYTVIPGGTHNFVNDTDLSLDFPVIACRGLRFVATIDRGNVVIREFYVYRAPYELTGTFTSKSQDYGSAPATYGAIAAVIDDNGESYQLFTQSSDDDIVWEAAVNVSNGGTIGSSLKRYLRWGITMNSSTGLETPVLDKVYVGGTYLSEIHNTGGDVFQWGAFQSVMHKNGETVTTYFRAATTEVDVLSQPWTAIVPGAIPNTDVLNQYIQIKIEMSTVDPTTAPEVESFTVNWIVGAGGVNTLQNVASVVILNRYWLAAATLGSEANDIVIVLGKNTYNSPFHKKPWAFLSFCRFQDFFVAGSSEDGSLYRLESGYSQNGEAMDSYFQTQEFTSDDFQFRILEIHITCDRSGPYNLYLGWSLDGGLTWTEKAIDLTRESGESLTFTKILNVLITTDSIRFRVRTNEADQPFSVDEIRAYYRLLPQRGTFAA